MCPLNNNPYKRYCNITINLKTTLSECEDEIGLWWGAVICVVASWRLGENDLVAQSIVEEKFPFGKYSLINNSHNDDKPLQHAALCVILAIKSPTRQALNKLVDQAGTLLEQSMVYYHCKQKSSQNVLVSYNNLHTFNKSKSFS